MKSGVHSAATTSSAWMESFVGVAPGVAGPVEEGVARESERVHGVEGVDGVAGANVCGDLVPFGDLGAAEISTPASSSNN